MTISAGSRHSMAYMLEATYGTTPATPTFKALRHKATTLSLTKQTFTSAELRADRQIADFRHGTKEVHGDINVELSNGAFNDFFQAAMLGTWAARSTMTASTISAASADNSFNDSANGFVTAGFVAGDTLSTSSFTTGANNSAVAVVVSVTSAKIIVTGPTLVTEAAGSPRTVASNAQMLVTGTTRRSFTIERNFSDIVQFQRYTGCEFDKFSLSVKPEGIVDCTFSVLGQGQSGGVSILSGATYPAATTGSPFDGFSGTITEGGTTIALVTDVKLDLVNGLNPLFVVGSAQTIQPSIGRSNVTGTVTAFFQDAALINKFINETASALSFTVGDGTNTMTFTCPRIKYTGAPPNVAGEGPIVLAMPFQAILDPVSGTNIQIVRSV